MSPKNMLWTNYYIQKYTLHFIYFCSFSFVHRY
uniref:Uncharacterized protein n=1 Tax=Arundo donax TaxID=35708 RepID=A0A0A8ZHK3_ARUDO